MVSRPHFIVTASLPGSDDTPARIEYGYYDDPEKEVVKWIDEDYITVLNVTKFEEFHLKETAPTLMIDMQKTVGSKAKFVSDPITDEEAKRNELFFSMIEQGDIILAFLGQCVAAQLSEGVEGSVNVFSYQTASVYDYQTIISEPEKNQNSALNHMHNMMHMYDIVKVEEDGVIPDLHFKHLSAIIRITLRNETGGPLFTEPSEINFTYPTGDDCSFTYAISRFSVLGDEETGYYLKENLKQNETNFISNDCSHFVNHNQNSRIPLPSGETYELYAVIPPRIGNQLKGDTFFIDIYDSGAKSGYGKEGYDIVKYSIEIPDFNIPIEPGKRYWFNLTATKENDEPKLMFTNEWKKAHPEAQ